MVYRGSGGSTPGWREKGWQEGRGPAAGSPGGWQSDGGGGRGAEQRALLQTALGSLIGAGPGGGEQALGPRHLSPSWALPSPVRVASA